MIQVKSIKLIENDTGRLYFELRFVGDVKYYFRLMDVQSFVDVCIFSKYPKKIGLHGPSNLRLFWDVVSEEFDHAILGYVKKKKIKPIGKDEEIMVVGGALLCTKEQDHVAQCALDEVLILAYAYGFADKIVAHKDFFATVGNSYTAVPMMN